MTKKGRIPKEESRAAEFRHALVEWKRAPESARPSLRELAHTLGTSHQLLQHFLKDLDKWRIEERARKARQAREEIVARVDAEGRPMTEGEAEQAGRHQMVELRCAAAVALLQGLSRIRADAELGPVHPAQLKMARQCAESDLPGAQEVVQKCLAAGIKKRKTFKQVVRETPRRPGETTLFWVRRIWDECRKYDTTNRPSVITEELLERYSRSSSNDAKNNLPVAPEDGAKSFRSPCG
jgi:hypothetical protein